MKYWEQTSKKPQFDGGKEERHIQTYGYLRYQTGVFFLCIDHDCQQLNIVYQECNRLHFPKIGVFLINLSYPAPAGKYAPLPSQKPL